MNEKNSAAAHTESGLDFTGQREEFLERFFRKGAEFTNELLSEVQLLKDRLAHLEEENILLKHQLASDDAIRDLLSKIQELEAEKRSLTNTVENAKEVNHDYEGRYQEVERELDLMANLYVASYQLHATLDAREVLSVLEQMLMQFVGAGSFAIFLRREVETGLVLEPVHAFHCDHVLGSSLPWGDGPIGEAASTGVNFIADPSVATNGVEPIVCVPMILGSKTVGVIAIFSLLEQKREFVDVDFELFKLLALHSASAIAGSGLMAKAADVVEGLIGYSSI